jgi:hypothetical protein
VNVTIRYGAAAQSFSIHHRIYCCGVVVVVLGKELVALLVVPPKKSVVLLPVVPPLGLVVLLPGVPLVPKLLPCII